MKVHLKDLVSLHQLYPFGLVIDCGGYLGEYTEEIIKRFNCQVILFEPIFEYAEICRNKFKDRNNIQVIQKAVGKDGEIEISKTGESSSQFKEGGKIKVESVSLVPFIRNVDILKLNCEGGEYEVLKDLDGHNLLKDIKEILVQFHKVGEDIDYYRKLLSKTHRQIYSLKWDLWIKTNV